MLGFGSTRRDLYALSPHDGVKLGVTQVIWKETYGSPSMTSSQCTMACLPRSVHEKCSMRLMGGEKLETCRLQKFITVQETAFVMIISIEKERYAWQHASQNTLSLQAFFDLCGRRTTGQRSMAPLVAAGVMHTIAQTSHSLSCKVIVPVP